VIEKGGSTSPDPSLALVERVLSGDRLLVRLLLSPTEHVQTILLVAGIRAPATKRVNPSDKKEQPAEPFGDEAQAFMEFRILQRSVSIVLLGLTPQDQLVGTVRHPRGNMSEFILKEGLARCSDFHSTMLGGDMAALREAEKSAKDGKLGIYKSHVMQKSTGTGNVEAVVSRVQSADTLYLRNAVGGEKRVNLSSVRQPK
jgi:staphylococcal nuclease domain-containing protein 1